MSAAPRRPALRVYGPTEQRNPATVDLDLMTTQRMLQAINAEDRLVAPAVERALPELAEAVDLAVGVLRGGGNLHYFGAGTSGRIASMDAAELGPTFAFERGRVIAHHAGGAEALDTALEDVEDDADSGRAEAATVTDADCVIGLTASGRTPYVAGAVEQARAVGAATVLVSSNPDAEIAPDVDIHICVETGPEAVAGSTRMKAGTAQKLVLNSFSTAVMVRLGRTYSNLMTSMVAKNAKLGGRLVAILEEASGRDHDTCARALEETEGDVRVALVRLLTGVDVQAASAALDRADGVVRAALAHLDATSNGNLRKDS
jgi:N-acetylmuramic acid 6-phosphate etherase